MRDRLIELLDDGCKNANLHDKTKRVNEQVADYLLANGVLVMHCREGDIVYVIEGLKENNSEIVYVPWKRRFELSMLSEINNTVFVGEKARERAEEHIRKNRHLWD